MHLTDDQKREFEVAFKLFDYDNTEVITREKLIRVMESLGQSSSPQEIDDMISEVDADGNGEIDLNEFYVLMSRNLVKHDTEEEYQELFKIFDIDNKGHITKDGLQKILVAIGEEVTDEDVRQIFDEADLDRSGFISYEEFVRMMGGQPRNT